MTMAEVIRLELRSVTLVSQSALSRESNALGMMSGYHLDEEPCPTCRGRNQDEKSFPIVPFSGDRPSPPIWQMYGTYSFDELGPNELLILSRDSFFRGSLFVLERPPRLVRA
jgi:hypothetical protein